MRWSSSYGAPSRRRSSIRYAASSCAVPASPYHSHQSAKSSSAPSRCSRSSGRHRCRSKRSSPTSRRSTADTISRGSHGSGFGSASPLTSIIDISPLHHRARTACRPFGAVRFLLLGELAILLVAVLLLLLGVGLPFLTVGFATALDLRRALDLVDHVRVDVVDTRNRLADLAGLVPLRAGGRVPGIELGVHVAG